MDYLTCTVEQVFQKAPPEMCQRYRHEMDAIMTRWKGLSAQLDEHSSKIQGHIDKLSQFQVGVCVVLACQPLLSDCLSDGLNNNSQCNCLG